MRTSKIQDNVEIKTADILFMHFYNKVIIKMYRHTTYLEGFGMISRKFISTGCPLILVASIFGLNDNVEKAFVANVTSGP